MKSIFMKRLTYGVLKFQYLSSVGKDEYSTSNPGQL